MPSLRAIMKKCATVTVLRPCSRSHICFLLQPIRCPSSSRECRCPIRAGAVRIGPFWPSSRTADSPGRLARCCAGAGLEGRAPSAGFGLWTTGITVPTLRPPPGAARDFCHRVALPIFLDWQAKISLFFQWLHPAPRDVYRVAHGSRILSYRSRNLESHDPPG